MWFPSLTYQVCSSDWHCYLPVSCYSCLPCCVCLWIYYLQDSVFYPQWDGSTITLGRTVFPMLPRRISLLTFTHLPTCPIPHFLALPTLYLLPLYHHLCPVPLCDAFPLGGGPAFPSLYPFWPSVPYSPCASFIVTPLPHSLLLPNFPHHHTHTTYYFLLIPVFLPLCPYIYSYVMQDAFCLYLHVCGGGSGRPYLPALCLAVGGQDFVALTTVL